MVFSRLLHSCAAAALSVHAPTYAQATAEVDRTEPAQEPAGESADDRNLADILVLGERLRSQVDTEQAPILVLNEDDIAAYGAGAIADLVAAIEPQTGSSRGRGGGRPVFLVNGVRIGSFREFRSYPPEAIQKVEVLPEETAQKFGFPPDRRVVNFILKDNFSAITVEGEYEQPSRGGYSVNEQQATLLKITKAGRINVNVQANDVSMLTEADRNIIQTPSGISGVASDPDPAAFRSLIADTTRLQADANFAKAFLENGTSVSLNGSFVRSNSRSLSGLDSVILTDLGGASLLRTFNADDPLERRVQTDVFSTSGSLNRPLGGFILTVTGNASLSDSRTEIDSRANTSFLVSEAASGNLAIDGALPELPDAGFDVANQKTYSVNSKMTLRGSPFYLPAGAVNTTFDAGYKWDRIESDDSRAGSAVQLKRGDISGGFNIALPITSTRDDVLAALGSITLNGQVGFNNYSDFGTLYRWSGGVNWSPAASLDLQATYVWREVPPSLGQLGSPQITNFNVTTFDFVAGDTALVTVTSGGNPALKAETQSDWNFSANWEFMERARLRLDYSRSNSDNVSSSFPFLTPEIEAAFPDRVTRDQSGRLSALDLRPVDFFQSKTERLSFGLNLRGAIGKATQPPSPPPSPPESPQSAGEGRPEGASPRSGGGPGGAGRPRRQMSEEQRVKFAVFRERLCQDDGEEFLRRFAEAVSRGETLAELPYLPPEQAQRILSRLRAEDGSISQENISRFRDRICSMQDGASRPAGQAAGGRGRGGGGGRAGGRAGRLGRPGSDGRARFFFNLTHSIELNREILIAPGGPLLDLLDGDSLSSTGNPVHSSVLEAGIFKNGVGMRISGIYTGSARIDGSGAVGSTDLSVDGLATINLRLFANLGAVLKKESGIFNGMRIAFKINNVFDGRRIIRDGNGDIPLSFQPLLLDPTGRYFGVDLRKRF